MQRIENQPQSEHVQQLIKRKYDREREWLCLGGVENWKNVLDSRDWLKLKELELDDCKVNDCGAEFLGSRSWPHLQILQLFHNDLTATGLATLIKKGLPKLKQLNIGNNNIKDEGLQLLLRTKQLPNLESFSVRNNGIFWTGLLGIPDLAVRRLKEINLNYNNIGTRGIKLLIKADLPLLTDMLLYHCNLGSQGFKHLTKSLWPSLSYLLMNDNLANYDGYSTLPYNNWPQLTQIYTGNENTESINCLCWLSVGWSNQTEIYYNVKKNGIYGMLREVMGGRFGVGGGGGGGVGVASQ